MGIFSRFVLDIKPSSSQYLAKRAWIPARSSAFTGSASLLDRYRTCVFGVKNEGTGRGQKEATPSLGAGTCCLCTCCTNVKEKTISRMKSWRQPSESIRWGIILQTLQYRRRFCDGGLYPLPDVFVCQSGIKVAQPTLTLPVAKRSDR